MDNFKNLKGLLINSNDRKATNLLNITIRLAISAIILLIIVIIWSYYVFRVSIPFVPPGTTTIQEGEIVNVDGDTVSGSLWHPINLFCGAQVNNPQQIPESESISSIPTLTCPIDKVVYNCGGSSESFPRDGTGAIRSIDNPYTIDNNICLSSQEININKSWCDTPGLDNVGYSNILRDRIKLNCCKDREYESNINYTGLIVYLLITIPIIYYFIDKLFNKFIYVKETEEREKITTKNNDRPSNSTGAEFSNLLDMLLGGVGIKGVVLIFIGYYILLPLFRYFFVSYRCENVTGLAGDLNCGNSCDTDGDCITLNNSPCSSCSNNICINPNHNLGLSFSDLDVNVNPSGVRISVCDISSILDYLNEEGIDDIYNKFIQPLNTGVPVLDNDGKKTAILGHLTANPSDKKKFTSYYYRFYPRQEIIINDTTTPFRVRIPNPPSISGYNYLLNNYIQLEEYSEPNGQSCSDIEANKDPNDNVLNELNCNNNHNCKWNLNTSICETNTDCPNDRYQLPIIDAISAHETLNDNLDLHNKVIRSGIDYDTSTNTYPDNLYPCNDVVFSNSFKIIAKNDISTIGTPISDMDNWINHFELKRDECSDKMGQCYLNDYICENSRGYPIPLKNLQLGSASDFTLGALNDEACQKALYPCLESEQNNNCMTLEEDTNGYIIENRNGGLCKQLGWNNVSKTWENFNDNQDNPDNLPLSFKCVPIIGSPSDIRFTGATVSNWVKDKTDITTKCKSVYKVPRSNIDEINTPNVNISNYYRWNSVSDGENLLCSEWNISGNTCPPSKTINNLATYRNSQDPITECCIDVMDQTDSINIYVSGDVGVGGANVINGVTPTQVYP